VGAIGSLLHNAHKKKVRSLKGPWAKRHAQGVTRDQGTKTERRTGAAEGEGEDTHQCGQTTKEVQAAM